LTEDDLVGWGRFQLKMMKREMTHGVTFIVSIKISHISLGAAVALK
jgi:hypothetical protein